MPAMILPKWLVVRRKSQLWIPAGAEVNCVHHHRQKSLLSLRNFWRISTVEQSNMRPNSTRFMFAAPRRDLATTNRKQFHCRVRCYAHTEPAIEASCVMKSPPRLRLVERVRGQHRGRYSTVDHFSLSTQRDRVTRNMVAYYRHSSSALYATSTCGVRRTPHLSRRLSCL